jgi:glycine reductase
MRDGRLAEVSLELAQPGESCRILPVFDIVEPRCKIEPAGADFPGILGAVRPVGMGRTRVLRGVAVTILNPDVKPDAVVPGRLPVVDMNGSPVACSTAAEAGRYAGLAHLVIVPRLADGLPSSERLLALRTACLRAATWLARQADEGLADGEEVYELTPCDAGLPRVAYVYQMHSHQRPTLAGEPLLYGDNCRFLVPTVLHPNEILDGAVVRSYQTTTVQTYAIQNHATVLDLYRRHGRTLNFVGVVVGVANQLPQEKDRATIVAGQLVRWTLLADGAVFSKAPGGAANVDMAMVAARCEELGVRTTVMVSESSGDDSSDGFMLFNYPSLNAIVTIESGPTAALPAVERVIAPTAALAERYQAAVRPGAFDNLGVKDYLGGGRVAPVLY